MASSSRQPSLAERISSGIQECQTARTCATELWKQISDLDKLEICIVDFNAKITRMVQRIASVPGLSTLREELLDLPLLLLAYQNISANRHWMRNRGALFKLYEKGIRFEPLVRVRVEAGWTPDYDHLVEMRDFTRQVQQKLAVMGQTSNTAYVSALKEAAEIVTTEWGRFTRALGVEDSEVSISSQHASSRLAWS